MTAFPAAATPGDPSAPARPALPSAPPYALEPVMVALPLLAECAQAAPLGGDREMALATLMIARLNAAALPPVTLPEPDRASRAERSRSWLSALTMPQPARMALLRSVDASVGGGLEAAACVRELMQVLTGHLTPGALLELGALAERLHLYYEQTP